MPRSSGAPGAFPADAPDPVRPLPQHPDLEFERKRAKRLLVSAKRGDPAALAVMTRVSGAALPETLKLSLAQRAVAREYGFSSWPKLAAYYEMWDRHERSEVRDPQGVVLNERRVGWLRSGQQRGLAWHAQTIATFLPRLYGRSTEEVCASPITEDEARFVVAREHGFRTWKELLAQAEAFDERKRGRHDPASPFFRASQAIRARDLRELERIVASHPDVLEPATTDPRVGSGRGSPDSLLRDALICELRERVPDATAITDWLAARTGGFQLALNHALGWAWRYGRADDTIRYLIARGANANWVAPNGISILEFALVSMNLAEANPDAVDALARHVQPKPEGLWIAAGLGNVPAVLGYFDRRGRLTAAARLCRPDWAAMGWPAMPLNPDATDEAILWEAAHMAVLCSRPAVVAALLDRGLAVDARPYTETLLHRAVGVATYPVAKLLLERGADPDAPQMSNRSPRWLAENLNTNPMSEARVQIRDLLANWPAVTAS